MALEIVWRNPETVRANRRHSSDGNGDAVRYILQEFVNDGEFGYWATISNLEIVDGGHAA